VPGELHGRARLLPGRERLLQQQLRGLVPDGLLRSDWGDLRPAG
jgi:hypothetical protein